MSGAASLASSADLRMMGRVLLSDLKLLAHHRLDPDNRPRPCLIVLDEFSALSAIHGMASRLGALRAGRFGQVLNGRGRPWN